MQKPSRLQMQDFKGRRVRPNGQPTHGGSLILAGVGLLAIAFAAGYYHEATRPELDERQRATLEACQEAEAQGYDLMEMEADGNPCAPLLHRYGPKPEPQEYDGGDDAAYLPVPVTDI